jgi:N-methylhydantoinase A
LSDNVRKVSRPVYFHEKEGFFDCPILDRYALREGNFVAGPAVIEEVDSTTIVHPDYVAEVVAYGVLLLRRA